MSSAMNSRAVLVGAASAAAIPTAALPLEEPRSDLRSHRGTSEPMEAKLDQQSWSRKVDETNDLEFEMRAALIKSGPQVWEASSPCCAMRANSPRSWAITFLLAEECCIVCNAIQASGRVQ